MANSTPRSIGAEPRRCSLSSFRFPWNAIDSTSATRTLNRAEVTRRFDGASRSEGRRKGEGNQWITTLRSEIPFHLSLLVRLLYSRYQWAIQSGSFDCSMPSLMHVIPERSPRLR